MPYTDQGLGYRLLAYVASAKMSLGNSPDLPNLTFETIFSVDPYGIAPDENPATAITRYLTDPTRGAGFPSAYLGDLSIYRDYCLAAGLVVSWALSTQAEGRQFVADLLDATNSDAVWSGGKLTIVPYGDTAISANGATYTPPSAPLYSLNDTDFKKLQGSNTNSTSGGTADGPIACTRLAPATQQNQWSVEYLDRTNNYNPTVIMVSDDAAVSMYGLRPADKKQAHFFCTQAAANVSAQLTMGRAQTRNTYAFTLGPEYIVLDPMDIVAITDLALGLDEQWVRITEITENDDNSLTIQAEEYLAGTAHAPVYSMETPQGYLAAFSTPPPTPWTAALWQPTYAVAGAFEIWIAMCGPSNFAGFEVWVSTDGDSYRYVGRQNEVSRLGTTTASLASVTPTEGMTIDSANTLSVDMTPSGEQLLSGTVADAQNGNTLCWIGASDTAGEYLAYETATLGSGETYALTYLRRGMFDTTPASHASGVNFVRLNGGGVFRFGLTTDRIGSTLYFKLLPFNLYGGGKPTLPDVTAQTITVVSIAPGPPSSLAIVPGNRSNQLNWVKAVEADVDHYAIFRGTGSTEPTAPTSTSTPFAMTYATTYTDADASTLAPGVVAWYWVAAVTLTGGISSWTGPVSSTSAQIVGTDIASGAVGSAALAAGAVGSSALAAGAVTGSKLATGAVGSAALASGSVGSAAIANAAVVAAALASGAVTTAAIASGAVTGTAIASGAIGSAALASGAVGNSALQVGAIETANLVAGTVTGGATDFETGSLLIGTSWTTLASASITVTLGCNVAISIVSVTTDSGVTIGAGSSGGGAEGNAGA